MRSTDLTERAHQARLHDLPGVELLDARYLRHTFAPHAHEGYAFGVITHGLERFRYRGADHFAGPGAVIALDPEVVHTGGPGGEDGWAYRMAYVGTAALERMLCLPGKDAIPSFPEPVIRDPILAKRLAALGPAVLAARGARERESALASVLAEMSRRHGRVAGPERRAKGDPSALRHIREHVQTVADGAAELASLVDLATIVGLSPTRLLRRYAQVYGLPPHAHIRELRLRHAARMLREGERPGDVAVGTGFADQSHLTRWFKRRTGVTPAASARALV